MGLNLSVEIGGVALKNPVMPASGTFSAREFSQFFDLSRLGALVVKGVSTEPWKGNPSPRIAETKGGVLNAIGLQNPGVMCFINDELPYLRQFDTKIVVNVCGHTQDEYVSAIERLSDEDIDLFELNISCPNVSEGGIAFGTDVKTVERLVAAAKKTAKKPLIVKLSPNVTDITEIARAAEAAGADALSLINTLIGMKIDINAKKPILANKTGGLSGGVVMPVAVRMVYQCARAVKIPLIGMGGIETGDDAVEFLLAGASAVAVGTASFKNPLAMLAVLEGIEKYMIRNNYTEVREIKLEEA